MKNTLTKRAAGEAGVASLDELLAGPTAIAFVKGDPVEAAKGLRDFAKANPLLVIKGGVLDGKPLTAAEVTKIADLESREVLLAKAGRRHQGARCRRRGAVPGAAVADGPPGRRAARQGRGRGSRRPRHPRPTPPPRSTPPRPRATPPPTHAEAVAEEPRRRSSRRAGGAVPTDRRLTGPPKGRRPWRSSAPTSCSTPSRR